MPIRLLAPEVSSKIAAGEVVSTGTCTGVVAVQPGDVMTAEFGDLGAVEVAFRARVRD